MEILKKENEKKIAESELKPKKINMDLKAQNLQSDEDVDSDS